MKDNMKSVLRERLDQNYNDFLAQLRGKTAAELIAMAPEISAVRQLHEELLDACDKDDVEFLLRFDDPLDVVRGYWESEITGYDHSGEMSHMLWEIRDRELYSKDQLTQHEKDGENPRGQDAMLEEFEHVELFGKPALFSNFRIDRSTVPDGWYCYDVRGSDNDPGRLMTLEEKVVVNHAGTILSTEEITFPNGMDYCSIDGKINFLGDSATIAEFCEQHRLSQNSPSITTKKSHKKNRSNAYER